MLSLYRAPGHMLDASDFICVILPVGYFAYMVFMYYLEPYLSVAHICQCDVKLIMQLVVNWHMCAPILGLYAHKE